MRQIVCFIVFILLLCGFDKKPQGVYVNFKNSSREDFKSLHVKISGKDYFFNEVRSGKLTKPIKVEKTYRYCFAEAITQKDTVILQPFDFVGETLFTSGKLTMEFYIFPEEGQERTLRVR
ncbi:hypothetical protein [Flavisolibacter nicotianae]|uniref:hypothetical protein n=1 Tax=Flavisolibacter nicotianae TaxID=2364882 RepID=UPI000EACC2A8|nr:hypothetical protein [Flavisolibacter nicotianae]